jgi:hypothetical protein
VPSLVEICILPEMETAGAEALSESRTQGLTDLEQAVAVYMAMRTVFALSVIQGEKVIH